MESTSKQTRLHRWHVKNGAMMANFGGYDMPLWYGSAKNEHLAVLTHAGIFDTSHMAVIMVSGPDAYALLQRCFTKDMDTCVGPQKKPLSTGRCVYGVFLNPKGEVIDDAIIYKLGEARFMVVVNAGMGRGIARHLESNRGQRDFTVQDLSDRVGKIDLQGPLAAKILSRILKEPQRAFDRMFYFSFKGRFRPEEETAGGVYLTDGTPVLLSRTGYTGEFGFEIFVEPEKVVDVWEMILSAGKEQGLLSCGLAARDSLRAGAVLPLSHQDIGPWPFVHNPWEFALPFNDDRSGFTKPFIGDDALLNFTSPEYTVPFVGYDLRKVSVSDPAVVIGANGRQIGIVLTCVTDMGIGRSGDRVYSIASPDAPKDFTPKGLCCGFIKVDTRLSPNDTVEIQDRRRKLKVSIADDIRPDRTARRPVETML